MCQLYFTCVLQAFLVNVDSPECNSFTTYICFVSSSRRMHHIYYLIYLVCDLFQQYTQYPCNVGATTSSRIQFANVIYFFPSISSVSSPSSSSSLFLLVRNAEKNSATTSGTTFVTLQRKCSYLNIYKASINLSEWAFSEC